MTSFMQEFEHPEIKLEDIKLSTNNFDAKNIIGNGGFGKAFKVETSHSMGRPMVALEHKVLYGAMSWFHGKVISPIRIFPKTPKSIIEHKTLIILITLFRVP
ncbi:ephrin type-A receptor 8 [Artemisia annua]|uniref:Ephrin type-A receptor 8 n=1 Tax=Artemisia annua TaxID=35608 RepID=A0A2U1LJ90_ARTAN|nr:ephrin type-A receptor 8 [Artemisia annua]